MFSPFERMVAWRYLRSKKAEGFVSVIAGFSFLGIMLGVATLIIVMSVMNGFREELVSRILGLNGHISVTSTLGKGKLTDYMDLAESLRQIDGVTHVTPTIERQALFSEKGISTGVVVRGITKQDFKDKSVLFDGIIAGDIETFDNTNIAIGTELAKSLGLSLGDEITLLSPQVKAGPFGAIPRSRRYTISIVYDVGMYEYNKGFVFAPLADIQKFYQSEGSVDLLEVMTPNPDDVAGIRRELSSYLSGVAHVRDWRDSNQSFYNALQVERNVMFLILTLIILVAAFNIISSMIMLVKDKAKDVAIMRTCGAKRVSILKIFIMTGALIGILGTLAGAALGISFALNIESIRQFLEGMTDTELFAAEIYFLSQLPAVIDWHEVTAVVLMALGLSLGATLYPALRASNLDPVEVLRYE